jgi:DNA (cytosine-5)-methyltransferase 1
MGSSVPNHQATAHSVTTLEKIRKVKIGEKLGDYQKSFGSAYRRLDPDLPSPTVTRSGYRDFVHPFEDRTLTVREMACLQGFPLDHEFFGTRLDSYSSKRKVTMTQFGQVGNAVPPPLAKAIALAVKEQIILSQNPLAGDANGPSA